MLLLNSLTVGKGHHLGLRPVAAPLRDGFSGARAIAFHKICARPLRDRMSLKCYMMLYLHCELGEIAGISLKNWFKLHLDLGLKNFPVPFGPTRFNFSPSWAALQLHPHRQVVSVLPYKVLAIQLYQKLPNNIPFENLPFVSDHAWFHFISHVKSIQSWFHFLFYDEFAFQYSTPVV